MNEEEANLAYEKIIGVLRDSKLEWVVEQVKESLDLGKTETKKADASEFIDDKAAGERRGRRRMEDFVTTEPFSNRERLELLLDAIQRVTALPEFEDHIISILDTKNVTFKSENKDDQVYPLKAINSDEYKTARVQLEKIIPEVRGAAT